MKLKIFFKLLIFFILFFSNSILADEDMEEKIKKISLELRCMTCQNQSVYDSESDFAKDIKGILEEKLKKGLSEREIKNYLTDRYGEYILFKPNFNLKNLLLWLFPFILVIFSILIFLRNLKKS